MTAPKTDPNQNQDPPTPDLENPNPPDPNSPPVNSDPPTRTYTEADLQRTHNLYGETLREQTQRAEKLQRELDELRNNSQQQPISDSDLTPEQLIKKHVQESVRPILDEFTQFRLSNQINQYTTIKTQFRQLPQVAAFFTQIEPYVDQEMQGKEPTIQNLHAATAKVIGMIQLQGFNNQNQNQPQNQNLNQPQNNPDPQNQPRNDSMRPPHLRPSNPPAPNRSGNGPVRRQLTELEKRVAREQGKTEDEYLAWLDVPPEGVVHSRIGLPEPK